MVRFATKTYLNDLARLYGVQTSYYDVHHRRQSASQESLLALLRSLGAPLTTVQDVPWARRERQQALWRRWLEPVTVVWGGGPAVIPVRLPADMAEALLSCCLKLENGEQTDWAWPCALLPLTDAVAVEGTQYLVKEIRLPRRLPWGYHRLTVAALGRSQESLIISAPLKAYLPPKELDDRSWGVFLPTYALHTGKSWGGGDFSDLEELMNWVGGLGGRVVATLPLLATFLDDNCERSPYRPASRLLWNEFYLDVGRVPELAECPQAQALLASSSFQKEIKELRQAPLVDYQRQMALKRKILQPLSDYFFTVKSRRLEDFRRFTEANPVVEDYACFQATGEKRGDPWTSWPQPLRDGRLKPGDYDESQRLYHLYVQWLAHQQIVSASEKAKEKGVQLYLDLPLGVHPDGYDVWRERDTFILDASAGAPPDAVFTRGQDWDFPPLHPEKAREQGYRYVIAYLRHHLRYSGYLRVDHVMGLHRLFCIPRGLEASQGVYLHYPADELYAILTIESHRNQAMIVGEDLGTVPPYVRPAMKKHGLSRMYILHYELATYPQQSLRPPSRDDVAGLNTHDMYPFAAFWQGIDIEEREKLGLLDKEGASRERKSSQNTRKALSAFLRRKGWLKEAGADTASVLEACLSFLAGSRARIVLVNLEDLWLENQPQNVPSTCQEYPNWQRKAAYGLEEFSRMQRALELLRIISRLRQRTKGKKKPLF